MKKTGKRIHMKKSTKSGKVVRLSNDELQKSRAGMLGRFPSPDLYEPEDYSVGSACDELGLQEEQSLEQEYGKSQE
jgi:hypothetical protein